MRPFLFIGLTTAIACVALASVVDAAPDSPQAPAPPPTRVVLLPAPPPPMPTAANDAGAAPWIVSKTAPDPQPIVTRSQWVYDLKWDKGDVYLLGVHSLELPAPQATPRVMGRFALELFEGPTLVERVRFDFPMLQTGGIPKEDAGTRRTFAERNHVDFDDKLVTRIGVIFPVTRKGNRLDLYDRATGARLKLPWPPPVEAHASADGGH